MNGPRRQVHDAEGQRQVPEGRYCAPEQALPTSSLLPRVPRSYGKQMGRATRVTVDEARRVIAAYNRWAERWNRHELDRDLPLSPTSDEGAFCAWRRPRSAMCWQPVDATHSCLIRVEGWRPFVDNGLFGKCLRQPVDPDRIVWAGWIEFGRGWT